MRPRIAVTAVSLFFAALLASAGAADAPKPAAVPGPKTDTYCSGVRANYLPEMLALLTQIDDIVPQLPAGERDYIMKESRAAESAPRGRYLALIKRPYYYALDLRMVIENTAADVREVEALPANTPAGKLIEAAANKLIEDSVSLALAQDHYIRLSPLAASLTPHAADQAKVHSSLFASKLRAYILCLAN